MTSAEDEIVGRPFKARRDEDPSGCKFICSRITSDGLYYWRWGRQWYVYDGVKPACLSRKRPMKQAPRPDLAGTDLLSFRAGLDRRRPSHGYR